LEEQHSFRPECSTLPYNLVFTWSFRVTFKINAQLDVVFIDFIKAFNLVNHDRLIKILIASGLVSLLYRGLGNLLLTDILESRNWVFVMMFSWPLLVIHKEVTCLQYYSSSLSKVHRKFCLIANWSDDMMNFMQINTLEDCIRLQNDLDYFDEWSKSLGLTLWWNWNDPAEIP